MGRGLAVWIVIMGVETVHGIVRGLFVPLVGEAIAGRIGWPIGMVIVFGVTFLTIRWIGLSERRALLGLGVWLLVFSAVGDDAGGPAFVGLAFLLSFCFEIAIGYARGLSNDAILAEINPLTGGLMVYSLVVMLLAPLIAARLRKVIAP